MSLNENGTIRSPLQQLEMQSSKSNSLSPEGISPSSDVMNRLQSTTNGPNSIDRDSIYSFDSVSTNGRLLDRLDLDNDDLFDNDDDELFTRSNSITHLHGPVNLKNIPITHPNNNARFPSYTMNRSLSKTHNTANYTTINNNNINNNQNTTFQIKNVSNNIIYSNRNASVDSFKADKELLKEPVAFVPAPLIVPKRKTSTAPSTSPKRSPKTTPSPNSSPNLNQAVASLNINQRDLIAKKFQGPSETLTSDNILSSGLNDTLEDYDEFNFNSSNDSIEHPTTPKRAPSAPVTLLSTPPKLQFLTNKTINGSTSSISTNIARSSSNNDTDSNAPSISRSNSNVSRNQNKRSVSDLHIGKSPSKSVDLTPEARIALSLQLRNMGKHREASYQLQIAANPPYNDLRSMYFYSTALKFGQGLKQNDRTSLKWLCKCIIKFKNPDIKSFNDLRLEDLIKIVYKITENDKIETNPLKLFNYYSNLESNQIIKIQNSIKHQTNVMCLVYHEFGNYFINGWGILRDEAFGLKCLSISSSMGNFNSMYQLGELWSNKTKNRKKDLYLASAWFRLAELFGIQAIGNSWIYKEKYLKG